MLIVQGKIACLLLYGFLDSGPSSVVTDKPYSDL